MQLKKTMIRPLIKERDEHDPKKYFLKEGNFWFSLRRPSAIIVERRRHQMLLTSHACWPHQTYKESNMVTDQDTLHLQENPYQKANQISFVSRYLTHKYRWFFLDTKHSKNLFFSVIHKFYNKYINIMTSFQIEEANHAA